MAAATTTNGALSTEGLPEVTYGFIGLGVMGYGMAGNLRAKIPKSSTLVVCELVESRRDKFVAEAEGLVTVAKSPKAVAEQAVSYRKCLSHFPPFLTKIVGYYHYYAS